MLRSGLLNALLGGTGGTGVMKLGMTYAAPMMMGMEMGPNRRTPLVGCGLECKMRTIRLAYSVVLWRN